MATDLPLTSTTSIAPINVCEHFAGNEKFLTKALALQENMVDASGSPVFDITLDLEDGAAVGDEKRRRAALLDILLSGAYPKMSCGLRVHPLSHPEFESDIDEAISRGGALLKYITVPKPRDLNEVATIVDRVKAKYGVSHPDRSPSLHILIETHGALAEVQQIAAIPEVEVLDFGIMDFISEHRGVIPSSAMQSPEQFTHPLVVRAKVEISAAAARFGKVASQNPTINVRDPELARQDAQTASRRFGCSRMWSVHPDQIPAILKGFQPSEEEVAFASRIIEKAAAASWGPIEVDGVLFDRASYRYYAGIVRRAGS